jgi:hypothetical protein
MHEGPCACAITTERMLSRVDRCTRGHTPTRQSQHCDGRSRPPGRVKTGATRPSRTAARAGLTATTGHNIRRAASQCAVPAAPSSSEPPP